MFEEQIQVGLELFTDAQLRDIDVDQLNMQTCTECMLGQVYGDYHVGAKVLRLTYDQALQCGFLVAHNPTTAGTTYAQLTREWKQALHNRQRSLSEGGE